jgi:hypothetical protein
MAKNYPETARKMPNKGEDQPLALAGFCGFNAPDSLNVEWR